MHAKIFYCFVIWMALVEILIIWRAFIEPLFFFSLWTQTVDSMFLDFEYLSLLFISGIFLHCGEKPRIPWRFKCLLHCSFPFICTKSKLLCFGTFHLKMVKLTLLIKSSLKLCILLWFLGHGFVVLWYFCGVFFKPWLCDHHGPLFFWGLPSYAYY